MKKLIFLLILVSIIGCEKDKQERNSNGIHVRQGFTHWGVGQNREYKFKDVAENTGYLTMFPIENIRQKVSNEILRNWNIEYWIYTSIEDAELAMVERLDMSSLFMYNIIDSPLSQGQIGDNCWHQLLVGAIQFLRNNVFVSITPEIFNSSVDSTIAVWLAKTIDITIIGSKKVYKADLIPAPNILSVEIVSDMPDDWGQSAEVKINAADPISHKLTFREVGAGFACTNDNGIFSITPEKSVPLYVSADPDKFRIMIWVWNEGHLVSLAEKEFSFSN